MHSSTISGCWRPDARGHAILYDATLIGSGALLVAVCAQVTIPAWPVDFTLQTMGVLGMGILLGSTRGALCLLLYLGLGAAGLPVFHGGGHGIDHVMDRTGGYLVGFVVAAFLTGWLAERGWDRNVRSAAAAMGLGMIVIFALGVAWLAKFIGPREALTSGVIPYIPMALVKIGLAAWWLPLGWRWLGRRGAEAHRSS